MIALIFFLSLLLGILLTKEYILCIVLFCCLLIICLMKLGKKSIKFLLITFALGTGLSFINITRDTPKVTGIVELAKDNYYIINSFGERLYVYEKRNEVNPGDILVLYGERTELNFPTLESQFDFKTYLNNKGVKAEFKVIKTVVKYHSIFKIKVYKEKLLSKFKNEDDIQFASSILYSDYDENDILNIPIHVTKLIRCGGFYINSTISFFTYFILIFIKNKKKSTILSIILCGLIFRRLIFNCVLAKCLVIKIYKWINKYKFNSKFSSISIYSIVGIIFLLINKNLAYNDSFIIGFLMPIFISIFINPINKKRNWKTKIQNALLSYLFFIPFELKYYYSIAPFSFLITLILSPIYKLLGILLLLCSIGIPLYQPVSIISFWSKGFNNILNLNRFEIFGYNKSCIWILLYYMIFVFLLYILLIRLKPLKFSIISVFSLTLLFKFIPFKNNQNNSVSFINVGQGDCCFIRKDNHVTLIDTGGSNYIDIAKDVLYNYCKKNKIYSIDNVIITHDDIDHCGALKNLNKYIKIKNVISVKEAFPIKWKDIIFNNYNQNEFGDDNEKSLVIGFNYVNKDFLIMGDAPISIEKTIIQTYANIPCDILKIGHHGSDTSTCQEFLNYLNPNEAIISVGQNYYGHPAKSVLERLIKSNIKTRRTDKEGTIVYTFKNT